MASFFQATATSTPLSATLPAHIILHTIKLQPLPVYRGSMDYKVIEAWIYSVDNCFKLTGLTDPSQ